MHPDRKEIRLRNYDYSAVGTYFITICSHNRECTFGSVINGSILQPPTVRLSKLGEIIRCNIDRITQVYPNIQILKSIIMPNHLHLLIAVTNTVQPEKQTLDKMLIPKVIQSFKASVTRQAKAHGTVWQNRFYDHIVRDEQEFQRIWTYIDNNPAQWQEDCYYT